MTTQFFNTIAKIIKNTAKSGVVAIIKKAAAIKQIEGFLLSYK